MAWINSQFGFADAAARGQDAWDLLVSEWGDTSVPSSDQSSAVFPAFAAGTGGVQPPGPPASTSQPPPALPGASLALPAPAAIAIGPRSTVDRCWVLWDPQKVLPSANLWDYSRRLSVGSPLIFTQPANRYGVRSTSGVITNGGGSVTVFPSVPQGFSMPDNNNVDFSRWINDNEGVGTNFAGAYIKADGTVATFGPHAAGTIAGLVNPIWIPPLLHLVFYLRAPVGAIPTQRFPLSVTVYAGATGAVYPNSPAAGSLPGGTESLVAMIPVYGRRTIVANMSAGAIGGNTSDMRLALINWGNPNGVGTFGQEVTVFTAAAVTAGASVRTVISPAFGDYLMVYCKPNVAGNNFSATIVATDV